MTHDPSPRDTLTAEEQALARRLAQLGPHGEPSPALDARILAVARAADDDRERRAPRRWPVALGVAASLVLAVGIAWRMRPQPGPMEAPAAFPAASAPAPSAHIAPPPDTAEAASAAPAPPAIANGTPTPSPPPPAIARSEARAVRATPPAEAKPTVEPAQVTQSAVVLDKILAPPPPAVALPAPPPAPPAMPAAQGEAAPAASTRKAAATPEAGEDGGLDAAAAADQAVSDEPETEVPPASAESPEVRQAWLQRIRELAASGQTDAARASLQEFVRRHPDTPLPDDLRALAR